MRVRAAVQGVDVSEVTYIESLSIRQDSREAISTCEIQLIQLIAGARYDVALYDQARYSAGIAAQEWQELVLWDQDTGQLLFGGFILSIQQKEEGPYIRHHISASDWGILFERAVMTHTWPAGTPDSTIISDALAQVPDIDAGTIVTQIANVGAIEVKDQRIRDVFDQVCELTGSEWAVSYDGKLNYYKIGSIVAPFGLSDTPNGTTTMPYRLEDYARDFSDAANRVLVLGGLTESGGEIRATANDAGSQSAYGVLSITLVDRNITDAMTASVWATTEVAQRSFPKPTVKASLIIPGLGRGMTVAVEAAKYGLSGSLILRSLEIAIAAPDRSRPVVPGHVLKYTATLGARPPDMVYTLRRMQRRPPERTVLPPAGEIPAGSIDAEDFAAGLAPVFIVNAKPSGAQWDQYPADAVFLNTADRKLYRRIAGNDWTAVVPTSDIEGQIQTPQLAPGSVTTTILADGSVVTAKIPAGAIQEPQIAASAVTANAIAANAIYSEAIQANAVKAINLAANSVVAGKIAALAVVAGNLAADSVTAGTIAAAAVTASAIAANAVRATHILAGEIDSTKLNATAIDVGGGTGKPGRFNVKDGSGNLVGQIGIIDSAGAGVYGGWFKYLAVGGTGALDAKFKADLSGNLIMNDAQITVTHAGSGSQLTTSPTTFDATYSSLYLRIATGTDRADFVSRGMVVYAGGTNCAALVKGTGNWGELTLSASGTLKVHLNANTGIARADGGFQVGGAVGLNFTINYTKVGGAAGTMVFTGGILTGTT
jgi:hypothetical protein